MLRTTLYPLRTTTSFLNMLPTTTMNSVPHAANHYFVFDSTSYESQHRVESHVTKNLIWGNNTARTNLLGRK